MARILHWTSVSLVLMSIITGTESGSLPESVDATEVLGRHASYAVLLLTVMFVRLAWRLTNINPVRSYTLHPYHKGVAMSVHWTIYIVIIT